MSIRTAPTDRPHLTPASPAGPSAPTTSFDSLDADGDRRARRRRRRWIIGLLAGLVAAALIVAAAALWLTRPAFDASDRRMLTADAAPTLQLSIKHPSRIRVSNVQVSIDGTRTSEATAAVSGGGARVSIELPKLDDGVHDVAVTIIQAGALRSSLREQVRVTVDTSPPALNFVSPRPAADVSSPYVDRGVAVVAGEGNTPNGPVPVTIGAEVGSTLKISSSAAKDAAPTAVEASDEVRRTVDLQLPQGNQVLTVVAADEAGNETTRRMRMLVDTVGPVLRVPALSIVKDPALGISIAGRDPSGVTLDVRVDGKAVTSGLTATNTTPAPHAGDTAPPASADDDEPSSNDDQPGVADEDSDEEGDKDSTAPAPIAGTWSVTLSEPLYEGRHVLEVIGTDSLGDETKVTRTFVVDSSEQLGASAGLRIGARGADVVELQQSLISNGGAAKPALASEMGTKSYGAATRSAVQAFQASRSVDVDGVAGSATIAALTLKVVIDRSTHQLTLYRSGSAVKSWGIAVGSPQYETPPGSFTIQTKETNPTWTPPDSDWAKDAKVIPPGPDNPLGTRWMAINGTIGIHGTNAPSSIGGSVSHGCIRMKIPDVEEFYDMVTIGTPVTVV